MEILVILTVIAGGVLIFNYWYIVLPVIVLGVIIYFIVQAEFAKLSQMEEVQRKKAEQQRKRAEAQRKKAEQQRQLEERKQQIMQTGFYTLEYRGKSSAGVVETFALVNEITKYPFIIDTNIWLKYHHLKCFWDQLAYCCLKNHRKVTIPSEVYDEIIHLAKKGKNGETKSAARMAKKLLLELDNKNLLAVYNLGSIRKKNSFADPVLIQVCKAIIKSGNSCYLFTNDQDLIIRARHLVNGNEELCKVLSVHKTAFSYLEDEYFIPAIEQ